MIAEKLYLLPKSLTEATEMAVKNLSDFKYISGGTDVMVNKYQGNEKSTCLIDLTKLLELTGINRTGNFLRIGALEKLSSLQYSEEIKSNFPVLIEAALSVGSPLLRKTATIGGNVLCENRCLYYNQSEWWRESVGYCLKCDGDICIATQGKNACFSELVSDTAPALIALNAQLEFYDNDIVHRVKLEDIYTGDGVKPRNLSKTAIVTCLLLPLDQNYKTSYFKLRERESLEFTSLTSAVSVNQNGNIKIALAGVDPKPVVVEGQIGDDLETLILKAIKGGRTVENDMYSRKYRREMIRVYLTRSFNQLLK